MHQHAYFLKRGRGSNEYRVIAIPVEFARGFEGHERIKRDRALREASWSGGPSSDVDLVPCSCGGCALSSYADEHPHSMIGVRVRKARRELESKNYDILGRERTGLASGEYEGERPRYEEGES